MYSQRVIILFFCKKVVPCLTARRRTSSALNVNHTEQSYPQEECIYEGSYSAQLEIDPSQINIYLFWIDFQIETKKYDSFCRIKIMVQDRSIFALGYKKLHITVSACTTYFSPHILIFSVWTYEKDCKIIIIF